MILTPPYWSAYEFEGNFSVNSVDLSSCFETVYTIEIDWQLDFGTIQ